MSVLAPLVTGPAEGGIVVQGLAVGVVGVAVGSRGRYRQVV